MSIAPDPSPICGVPSPFSLHGKRLLVVGVDTPTGRKAASIFAQRGAQVIAQATFSAVEMPLDGLLYCSVSAQPPMTLENITETSLQQVIANRLSGPVLAIKQLTDSGVLRDGASVVLEKFSINYEGVGRFLSVEGGVGTLVASMALECARRRIRVNAITTKAFPDACDMEDFAHAAVYLLSPASRWVTGSDLVITGQATR